MNKIKITILHKGPPTRQINYYLLDIRMHIDYQNDRIRVLFATLCSSYKDY